MALLVLSPYEYFSFFNRLFVYFIVFSDFFLIRRDCLFINSLSLFSSGCSRKLCRFFSSLK